MIGKSGSGWQTTTADLALILFLVVSAAAADRAPAPIQAVAPAVARPPAPTLEPSPSAAIYRRTAGTSLSQWLSSQTPDERQIATVLVSRATSGPSPVMEEGLAFLDEIEASGRMGRLLVQRGESDDVTVVLAYDREGGSGMALAAR